MESYPRTVRNVSRLDLSIPPGSTSSRPPINSTDTFGPTLRVSRTLVVKQRKLCGYETDTGSNHFGVSGPLKTPRDGDSRG